MFKGFFISDDLAGMFISINITGAVGNKYMFLSKVGNKFNGTLFDVVTSSAIHPVRNARTFLAKDPGTSQLLPRDSLIIAADIKK